MGKVVRRNAMYGRATESKKYAVLFYTITLLMLPLALPMELVRMLGDLLEVPLTWLLHLRSNFIAWVFVTCKWEGAKVIEYEVDDDQGGGW